MFPYAFEGITAADPKWLRSIKFVDDCVWFSVDLQFAIRKRIAWNWYIEELTLVVISYENYETSFWRVP